jgi:hypothetical protein
MIYFVTASKDASVFELTPTKNTGLDEILTISKHYSRFGERDNARTFIQFDLENIPSHVTASNVVLNLKLTQPEELIDLYTLYGYPVTESWSMGRGTHPETINTDGINWNTQVGVDFSVESSQSFNYFGGNIEMDIKSIYDYWDSSNNYGIRLSHTSSVEETSLDYGVLRYYSKETNTIFQPLLKLGWDDQIFETGSLTPLTDSQILVRTKELRDRYKEGNRIKIKIIGRTLYPTKTFTNVFSYNDIKYLPQSSYYAVRDEITKVNIIDFSEYTKISCNAEGNYITLDTSNFPKSRVYRLLFKIVRDGISEFIEDDLTFIVE